MIIFDDMFLTTKDRQLKIKFNPNSIIFQENNSKNQEQILLVQFPLIVKKWTC